MIVNRLTLSAGVLLLACLAAASAGAQAPAPAGAQTLAATQSLASIDAAAEAAVRRVIDPGLTDVKLATVALDPRLRLAPCARLDTFANAPRNAQSRVIARISCVSPAWTLNVPVEIRRTHTVLVLRRALGRGEAVAATDVVAQKRELPGLASPFVARPEDLAGRLTRRPLPEGTAVTAEALSAALLIKRGQQVTLVAQSAGFEVRAPGRAMADAAANQRIRVQNLNSLKIVEGLADNDGTVRVAP
jgi:flagella basal body P-ring formation protein FlgA